MELVAEDVQTAVLPDCAHWVAEQAPEAMLAALVRFLVPYRDGWLAGPQSALSLWGAVREARRPT